MWYIGSLQYDIDYYSILDNESIKSELSKKYGIDGCKRWILYADNIIKEYQPSELYEQRRQDSFDVIKKIAIKNPDALIIYRPHPETSKEEMRQIRNYFIDNDNVVFNNEGHIYYWTASSDATIVWCSTSSLQAMFMNKPIFGFMTSDKLNLESYWFRGILPLYEDYEKLADDLYKTFEGELSEEEAKTREARAGYVKEWYFKKDGMAFNRFVALIKEVEKSEFRPLYGKECNMSFSFFCSILYYQIRAFIGDFVKRRNIDRNISDAEITSEKQKYDFARYKHKDFVIKHSESGKFFE